MQSLSESEMRETAQQVVDRFESRPRMRWTDDALFVYQLAKAYLDR